MPNELTHPIYEQQEGEPLTHYEWFHVFLLMGPSRSMLAAAKIFYGKDRKRQNKADAEPSTSSYVSAPGAWREAAEKWKWSERARAWDKENREEARRRRAEWEITTETKFKTTIDWIHDLSASAEKVAKEMLNYPLLRRESKTPDGKQIIIEPAGWDMNTAVRLVTMIGKTLKDSVEAKKELDSMHNSRTLSEAFESGDMTEEEAKRTLELLGYAVFSPEDVVTITVEQMRDNEMLRLQSIGKVLEAQILQGDKTAVSKMMAISRQITALQGLNLPAAKERPRPKGKKRDMSKFSENEKLLMAEILDPEREAEPDPNIDPMP